ncbi:copper chaperone for superoxide dismutase [Orussus abietinus]|uniref:copper chaperone for superoxide dismutase n=1 Tax=Orussus abietinus TaxID=222816 RepID=UPI0006251B20|nr:copper chaperone for superoxide dismutase [Orussus abietinus]
MGSTKIEFAVQMTCQNCVNALQNALSVVDGVQNVEISLENGTVIVDTSLPYSLIQDKIEDTGRKAVLKGYGVDAESAVSMLGGNSGYSINNEVNGVIRFVQTEEGCIIDGTVDGLSPGPHGLHVHECGDISKGCESVGEHFNPDNTIHGGPDNDRSKRHLGDLGNIVADTDGCARFRIIDNLLKVYEIIGRSLVVTEGTDDLGKGNNSMSKVDGNSGKRLACGIIARSSGLFQNVKKICACDGVTLWEEREQSVSKMKNSTKYSSTAIQN